MKRCSLFGFLLLPFFPRGKAKADPVISRAAAKLKPVPLFPVGPYSREPLVGKIRYGRREGPTMWQLYNLQQEFRSEREYYERLFVDALKETGPIVIEAPYGDRVESYVISHKPIGPVRGNGDYFVSHGTPAEMVLVPFDLLKHFKPENRGEEFPPGIPYEPLV